MAEQLTLQQEQAVKNRGGKLLVSAAAGSGKTKVLVERLLDYLTDPNSPAEMDEFLIITYTKAAAAELRAKIAAKLTEKIAEQPNNKHLQRQIQRLFLAKIATVHSFCSDILREYAYMLDIPADFRVLDEDESVDLKAKAMTRLLDAIYFQMHDDSDICAFIETQGYGRDDRRIPEIITSVYDRAFCHLDPISWMDWCCNVNSNDYHDASETIWGKYLIEDLFGFLDLHIPTLERAVNRAMKAEAMEKVSVLLTSILDQLRALRACNSWDEICDHKQIDYGRLVFSKKIADIDLADQIKLVRDACKNGLAAKLSKFTDKSAIILADFEATLPASRGLVKLVKKFMRDYQDLKKAARVLDFSDLEHRTLDLLVGKSRGCPTKLAQEIGSRFREVMVDEYQDANLVLDVIFGALTGDKQNCFMVGDVKQSIYQFRLADPSIFIEKYNSFIPADSAKNGQGRKVILSQNFRSCGSVIQAVNDVFSTCMSENVGGLSYGPEEALYEGIPHIEPHEPEIELYGLDVQSDTYTEEAAFVAQRISQLLDGTHMIRQGDNFRPITPDDIVIILRSPGPVGYAYQYALAQRGIKCNAGAGEDLFETEEIQTLISILQTINNPAQDIPLVATLTSKVFCFTADDLTCLRAAHRCGSVYDALKMSDSDKAKRFLESLDSLRRTAQLECVSKLLMQIFNTTRIDSLYSAMPDGDIKVENLHNFCRLAAAFETNANSDLNSFLSYLNRVMNRHMPIQTGAAGGGAVTIMSIHKSKGLEFPVVFLCALSRKFNQESLRAQVLCHKDLGLGLSCVDTVGRIQYPSISRNAIAAKLKFDMISEELRVLYVAMTRAKDRLIMTYATQNVQDDVEELGKRMELSELPALTASADCPGRWILLTALTCKNDGWKIQYVNAPEVTADAISNVAKSKQISHSALNQIHKAMSFDYPFSKAVIAPSKQTATQLKGRSKDSEVADNTELSVPNRNWRKPTFVNDAISAVDRGNVMHTIMQHIQLDKCADKEQISQEIKRIVEQGYISPKEECAINISQINSFFCSDIGIALRNAKNVLREFKFSILMDADDLPDDVDDRILLQGVIDCAMITDEGISIVDFKTDRVTDETVGTVSQKYRPQIEVYANALSRIYRMPVKSAQLYFFNLNRFISII